MNTNRSTTRHYYLTEQQRQERDFVSHIFNTVGQEETRNSAISLVRKIKALPTLWKPSPKDTFYYLLANMAVLGLIYAVFSDIAVLVFSLMIELVTAATAVYFIRRRSEGRWLRYCALAEAACHEARDVLADLNFALKTSGGEVFDDSRDATPRYVHFVLMQIQENLAERIMMIEDLIEDQGCQVSRVLQKALTYPLLIQDGVVRRPSAQRQIPLTAVGPVVRRLINRL